jgi:hypothetical protein
MASTYVDVMTTHEQAETTVRDFLAEASDDVLGRVSRSAALLVAAEEQQKAAVVAAHLDHSWSEIGAALGVSKQAAHRKFVTLMADDLKAKHREMKRARRAGRTDEAAAALGAVVATAETLRGARRLR